MRTLVRLQPDRPEFVMQLAAYLIRDERPRAAIKIYDELLSKSPEYIRARVGRADAFLEIGNHAQAIAIYDELVNEKPEELLESILNNLAWVLSTSPEEGLRDGKRAISLAQQACELTEYREPHILSTLAAAFAEAGDFDKAREWSQKAVELGADHHQAEQLKQELASYERNEAWRERKEVAEKAAVDGPSEDDLRPTEPAKEQPDDDADAS